MVNNKGSKTLLSAVDPDKHFWVNQGPVVGSLGDFADAAKGLSKDQFQHHVGEDKNDFAVWLQEVVGDSKLAEKVKSAKTKGSMAKVAAARVKHLEEHI